MDITLTTIKIKSANFRPYSVDHPMATERRIGKRTINLYYFDKAPDYQTFPCSHRDSRTSVYTWNYPDRLIISVTSGPSTLIRLVALIRCPLSVKSFKPGLVIDRANHCFTNIYKGYRKWNFDFCKLVAQFNCVQRIAYVMNKELLKA